MSWFAPKILKSEYDKVVAENLELKMMLDELTKPDEKKVSRESEENFKKHEVKRDWVPEFSPEDLTVSVIESLVMADDIKRVKNKFYRRGKRSPVAEESDNGVLKVSAEYIRDVYNDLNCEEFPIKRLPSGTLAHLYNHKLIKARYYGGDGKFQYHWSFDNNEPAYIFTEKSIQLYKKQGGLTNGIKY